MPVRGAVIEVRNLNKDIDACSARRDRDLLAPFGIIPPSRPVHRSAYLCSRECYPMIDVPRSQPSLLLFHLHLMIEEVSWAL